MMTSTTTIDEYSSGEHGEPAKKILLDRFMGYRQYRIHCEVRDVTRKVTTVDASTGKTIEKEVENSPPTFLAMVIDDEEEPVYPNRNHGDVTNVYTTTVANMAPYKKLVLFIWPTMPKQRIITTYTPEGPVTSIRNTAFGRRTRRQRDDDEYDDVAADGPESNFEERRGVHWQAPRYRRKRHAPADDDGDETDAGEGGGGENGGGGGGGGDANKKPKKILGDYWKHQKNVWTKPLPDGVQNQFFVQIAIILASMGIYQMIFGGGPAGTRT